MNDQIIYTLKKRQKITEKKYKNQTTISKYKIGKKKINVKNSREITIKLRSNSVCLVAIVNGEKKNVILGYWRECYLNIDFSLYFLSFSLILLTSNNTEI